MSHRDTSFMLSAQKGIKKAPFPARQPCRHVLFKEFRPEALRPTLSNGLPLSDDSFYKNSIYILK